MFASYGQWLGHSGECARALGQLMEYYELLLFLSMHQNGARIP